MTRTASPRLNFGSPAASGVLPFSRAWGDAVLSINLKGRRGSSLHLSSSIDVGVLRIYADDRN